jgi:hypothetical protein
MAKLITKFIRKRNANTALPQNKLSARVQVTSASQTFMFKKTVPPAIAFTYLQPDGNDYFQPDGTSRYLQP